VSPFPARSNFEQAFRYLEIRNLSDRNACKAIGPVRLGINDRRRASHDVRDEVAGAWADTEAVAAEARGQHQAG
jgi:hypothetical protein